MELSDFQIGCRFRIEGNRDVWECTDVGSRVVVAINLSGHVDDPRDLNGPPYGVAEMVFDEYSLPACEIVENFNFITQRT